MARQNTNVLPTATARRKSQFTDEKSREAIPVKSRAGRASFVTYKDRPCMHGGWKGTKKNWLTLAETDPASAVVRANGRAVEE